MSKSLGRGLGSLIPPKFNSTIPSEFSLRDLSPSAKVSNDSSLRVVQIPVNDISANPFQPRSSFSETEMNELKESIRSHGILQPLLVTRSAKGYQLVAGERRLRAAKALHFKTVPAIVRTASELEKLELAMIENVQRQDLNPIEEAQSYHRLIDEFSLTQEDIAKKTGKSRSRIANALRLLKLPSQIQRSIASGAFSVGHAKILLGMDDPQKQLSMWKRILEQGISVASASEAAAGSGFAKASKRSRLRHPFLETQEEDLRSALGTKVSIRPSGKGGKIIVEYYSAEELLSLIQKMIRRRT